MHYKNGRAAKVGDLVRGTGYNLKFEFTGVLISAQPENLACNCTVATVTPKSGIWYASYGAPEQFRLAVANGWGLPMKVDTTLEYGQLDAFVAIDPETGLVLEPEALAGQGGKQDGIVEGTVHGWTEQDKALLGRAEGA